MKNTEPLESAWNHFKQGNNQIRACTVYAAQIRMYIDAYMEKQKDRTNPSWGAEK